MLTGSAGSLAPKLFIFKNSLLLGVCWKCFKNQIRIFPQFKQFLLNILWYPYTFISAVLMKGIIMNCYLSRSNSPTFVNLTFLCWILDCIGCRQFETFNNILHLNNGFCRGIYSFQISEFMPPPIFFLWISSTRVYEVENISDPPNIWKLLWFGPLQIKNVKKCF